MKTKLSNQDMHIVSVEIVPPLPGGQKFEAKVLRIFADRGYGREELKLPAGENFWALSWGVTESEAKKRAADTAKDKALDYLSGSLQDRPKL